MVVIRIADYSPSPSTYEDGARIFDLMRPHLTAGEKVQLSFEGITAVPSAFVNSALLPLLDIFPMEQIKLQLRFTNTTKFINKLIKQRFEFVATKSSQ